MATSTAQLSDYRQSPRKVRVVTDLVRGKSTTEAMAELAFLGKRAGLPIQKLIASAVSNARGKNMAVDSLVVKDIRVDAGKILYRRLPMSRGRAFTKRKRTSHITVTLEERVPKVKKVKFQKEGKKVK